MGEKSKKSEFKKSNFLKMKKPNFYLKMMRYINKFNDFINYNLINFEPKC